VTAATVTLPLQNLASNTLSVSSSRSSVSKMVGESEKEGHVSPAPLGTADSNVPLVINASATMSAVKAVKRGAAPGVAAGGKRKALKRL
jgi:hypothetical protein